MKCQNENGSIYLDWAATALPNTYENRKALDISECCYGNPSAKHRAGKAARDCIEAARSKIAYNLGVKAEQIFFTSGASESNQIILLSNLVRPNFKNYSIAISALEHPSLRLEAKALKKLGLEVLEIPSDKDGLITPEAVLKTIKDNTVFVSVMAVNNEVGSIQPISEISKALKKASKRKIHFHTDAVQAIGKTIFNIDALAVDSLSMSAHKIGGMRGLGFLYLRDPIEVFNKGGGQEAGIRAGTENLAGLISLELALEKYKKSFTEDLKLAQENMGFLISELSKMPYIQIIPEARKIPTKNVKNFSPYILQLAHKNIAAEVMLRSLSDRGIYISTGSACSSGKKSRAVLDAMKVASDIQQKAFRISLGNKSTKEDLTIFIKELAEISECLS